VKLLGGFTSMPKKKIIIFSLTILILFMVTLLACPLLPLDLGVGLTNAIIQTPGNGYSIAFNDIDDSTDALHYQRTLFQRLDYTKNGSSVYNGVYRQFFSDRMLKTGGHPTIYGTYQYNRSNTNQRVLKFGLYEPEPGSKSAGYETSRRWRFRPDTTPDATFTDPNTGQDRSTQRWALEGEANCTDDGFGWNWSIVFWDASIDARTIGQVCEVTLDFDTHTITANHYDQTPTRTGGMYITVIGDMAGENEDLIFGAGDIFPF
jgi:hypothetical protein